MIVDKLENAHLYTALGASIAKALEILKNPEIIGKEPGRYDIDGDNLYYMIQHYESKAVAEGKLEAHKNYIDVQFVAAGEEMLGYAPTGRLEVDTPYDADSDFILFKPVDDMTPVALLKGMFCILFPDDAHMPCRQLNGPTGVQKVVIKIKI